VKKNPMPDNILLAGIIGAVSALAGVGTTVGAQVFLSRQAHQQQMERDKVTREQSVQDDKQTRIRQYFAKIYWASHMHLSIAHRIGSSNMLKSIYHDNPDERQENLINELREVNAQTQEALAILVLEFNIDDVIEAYGEMDMAFDHYLYELAEDNRYDTTGLEVAFEKLREVMRRRHNELEKLMIKEI
jgi:hypothetical protein